MYIDIGVNLTSEAFAKDRDAVIRRAIDAGVQQMIVTGTDVASSEAAIGLAGDWPGRLFATVGVHPHHATTLDDHALARLEALAAEPAVVAMGECGLDFNRNYSPPEVQEQAFAAQLELAAGTQKPVFLHQRDAHAAWMRILEPVRPRLAGGVAHCFTDSEAALLDYLRLDLHIGITGWICDERRGQGLRELVPRIPGSRLMIETDAPYLLPRDLPSRPRNRRNEPLWLPHIAAAVARARGEEVEQFMQTVYNTTRRFFRLPDVPAARTENTAP